ncbi:MAG: DUF835 domain-containing protein [Candidatus Altiarchaeota archaeon]|nr:DUF835 domain-containing protein [Candidatus Altiarchaeota archaeon]
MDGLVIVLKSVSAIGFLIALNYSIRCHYKTRRYSHTWLYITFAMGTAFILAFVRLLKEFWLECCPYLDIIKVELIPVVIAFLVAAAFTVRREKGFPVIIPVKEDAVSLRKTAVKVKLRHSYLVVEERPKESMNMCVNALSEGFTGLCICRRCPYHIEEEFTLKKTPCVWLTETEIPSREYMTIGPDLEKLLRMIGGFISMSDKGIIFIGGLDYLIEHNTFERTLSFVERLSDKISMSNFSLVMSINPYILNEKEEGLLGRWVDVVK